MPVTLAPVLPDADLTTTLLKVTMAWQSWQSTAPVLAGWHRLEGTELGLAATQLREGIYVNANGEAIVAAATFRGHRTLTIGFRGTNDAEDWRQDFQNVNQHYDLFAPLVAAVKSAVTRGEFDLVLVTGHSLGGAMTQMFMADYTGIAPAYALTTGAPGFLQDAPVADARIINYQVTDDPIVYLADNRALVGQILGGPLGLLVVPQLTTLLSQSFGIPSSTFTDSIPLMTRDYYDRGTHVMLAVPGHPATPPSSPLALITTYNSTAHEFPAYLAGIALTNQNPFDLAIGSRGTAGHNALFGTTGADTIDGGAGADTLYLHVTRASATVTSGSGGLTRVASPESGSDTLTSVERLAFTDKRLAFDLGADAAAGKTARVIGAAFDAPALQAHPNWVGTGLQLFDQGMSLVDACQVVVRLMGSPSNAAFVDTVFSNVVGRAPSAAEQQQYAGLLTGSGGTMSQAELLQLAASTDANAANIGLVGLQTTGLEFV